MKKVLTILIGMVLVFSMVCGVSAADITAESTDKYHDTTVTFTVAESYKVTIPDSIVIDPNDGKGLGTVSVKIYKIEPDHVLNVTLTGDSYNSGSWYLTHNDASDDTKLGYFINKGDHVPNDATVSPIGSPDVVLSVPADVKDVRSVEIHCRIMGYADATHSGAYSDRVTFTVSIVDDPDA